MASVETVAADRTLDDEIDAALERAQHLPDLPDALSASYLRELDAVVLKLEGGRRLILPRKELQGLQNATEAELSHIEIFGGTDIAWPDLDVDHNLRSLVAGQYGSNRWMRELERLGLPDTPNNGGLAVARLTASHAMYPMIGPFCYVQRQPLHSVKAISEDGLTGLVLVFDSGSLVLSAIPELDLQYVVDPPHGADVSQHEPWREHIGSRLALGWLAMNQHGYFNTVLLAFEGAIPEIAVTALTSELRVLPINTAVTDRR